MKLTLEQRVESLEKNVSVLAAALRGGRSTKKDWRKMEGRLHDSEFAREADRLGRQYRARVNKA